MKRREIFLDFTSLLDVTLIVIFFFVLFSHLDSQANQARTDEKVQELDVAIQQAEARESSAEELEQQLQKEMEILSRSNNRQGENSKEIVNFFLGDNIKIIMETDSDSWYVQIVKDGELQTTVSPGDDFSVKLRSAFKNAGYVPENTILCELIYDGSKKGTNSAYNEVKDGLSEIMGEYNHLYVSETDLSVGGE
ncbi:MAG: hypothetical protein J5802_06755 [Butyrivibrio sp.]|nr:hypothetical protein [Butyrivibrio sp.]